jgi:hypothetical protein
MGRWNNMPTLQQLKKQNNLTNATIARSLNCSASKVSTLLQGRHIRAISDAEIESLATALSVTFERCWMAMCESYNEWNGTPGMEHQRPSELRSEVFQEMGLSGHEPRPMAMVDSCLVVPEERRLENTEPTCQVLVHGKTCGKPASFRAGVPTANGPVTIPVCEEHCPGIYLSRLYEASERRSE